MILLQRLVSLHERLNAEHFGGALASVPIRLSGRMRTRLGELAVDLRSGRVPEIAISRHHILRHPWTEVEHTLLHEMVHQWQAESGQTVDHGRSFRRKAREVGIEPQARRQLTRRSEDSVQAPAASRTGADPEVAAVGFGGSVPGGG